MITHTLVKIPKKVIRFTIYTREKMKVRVYKLFNESSNLDKELIKDDDELVFSGKIIADMIPKHYEDLILDIEVLLIYKYKRKRSFNLCIKNFCLINHMIYMDV